MNNLNCVVLVVNEGDFGTMVEIVDGNMWMGLSVPFTMDWVDSRDREFPMLLHFDESITYSGIDCIDQYNVISSAQFAERWEKHLELSNKLAELEFKVGDKVVLTDERPPLWNKDGMMDSFLGSTQVIMAIEEPMHGWSDDLVVKFEDRSAWAWSFRYGDISYLAEDEPMVMVVQYPVGRGIDWKLGELNVIIPEEYEGIADAYAIEQFDKIHGDKKIYGIYEK